MTPVRVFSDEDLWDVTFDGPLGIEPRPCAFCGKLIDGGFAKGFWSKKDARFRVVHVECMKWL